VDSRGSFVRHSKFGCSTSDVGHSRHSRHPGVSGSLQERTFGCDHSRTAHAHEQKKVVEHSLRSRPFSSVSAPHRRVLLYPSAAHAASLAIALYTEKYDRKQAAFWTSECRCVRLMPFAQPNVLSRSSAALRPTASGAVSTVPVSPVGFSEQYARVLGSYAELTNRGHEWPMYSAAFSPVRNTRKRHPRFRRCCAT
jgi:hypothetical protein